METIFPREEKADLLFDKILKDPEACERLMQTFYGEIDSDLAGGRISSTGTVC